MEKGRLTKNNETMNHVRLICRSSNLSVIQANEIMAMFNKMRFSLITSETIGDKNKHISLMDNPDPDFFTREIDEALSRNEADIAVHSAKDLPYPLPQGIEIIALTKAEYKADALVSKNMLSLKELPKHAKIGTSSMQRKNQVLQLRPDLKIVSIRGTIEERIEYVNRGEIHAVIVAECALRRLQLDHLIADILPFDTHPLQGNLAVTAKSGNVTLKSKFYNMDERKKFGNVFLAGMGPGNGDLLTLQAKKALDQADVIYYDALIDSSILEEFDAQKTYVGKRKNAHSKSQDETNELMYQAALSGKTVVRLKGGDPLIFGRGSEEFDYLKSRMIDVEIIPGITTASATAAYLGIGLTERNVASSVAYCTGSPSESIQVPEADTLVYYMAASNAKLIAEKVISTGKNENTPAVFISNYGNASQHIEFTNLKSMMTMEVNLSTPLLLMIGDAIIDKNMVQPENDQPKVLVTGNHPEKYKTLGKVIHAPVIEIVPFTNYDFLKAELPQINPYDWLIFTSSYAVQYFFHGLTEIGLDLRWLNRSKILSIGKTTTAALKKRLLSPDVEMVDESTDGIIQYFKEQKPKGNKILIPRSDMAKPGLPNTLSLLGYLVEPLIVYQNRIPAGHQKVNLGDIDILVFSSPSCVYNFLEIYSKIPGHVEAVTRGNATKRALQDALWNQYKPDFII
jgi:uroporphyrinogen III methyltransferase/synthase